MSVITLATAKQWLQIGHTSEDGALQIMLDAIEAEVAAFCGVSFTSRTVKEDLPAGTFLWPCWHPITAITSIVELDASETIDADTYEWRSGGSTGTATVHIWRTDGSDWYECTREFPWRVSYTAGYSTLPAGLKAVVLELLKHAHDSRGGKSSFSPQGSSMGWVPRDVLRRLAIPFSMRVGVDL